ncbi:calmodulin-2/4-like isoform X1 [Gigantopelta aegis]|uniref:calmodulin-2/4-like isoform X1 n=1 Tax=Gigantopelta aegis TaxID=1735272 RepID=UPI001B88A307|nr:calmodulin-2/4-like isoform X1 [Gigantopelta aegis]
MASDKALENSIKTIKSVFQRLAGKHDDPTTISCFEFVTGMQAEEQFSHMSVDELKEMFFDVAADGVVGEQDYMITEEEFINALTLKHPKSVQQAELKAAFKEFDTDGSGVITAGELRTKLEEQGWKFNDEQFERLTKQADVNGDGNISFEEFVNAFKQDRE